MVNYKLTNDIKVVNMDRGAKAHILSNMVRGDGLHFQQFNIFDPREIK